MTKSCAPLIVFLHALPLDGRMWADQMPLCKERGLAPDLYRFGSDIRDWAKGLLALTEDRDLILVGCSVGGSVALELACLAPNRVVAMVLAGTKPHHRPDKAQFERTSAHLLTKGVAGAWRDQWAPLLATADDAAPARRVARIALDQTAKDVLNGVKAFHTRPSREAFARQTEIPLHFVSGDADRLPGPAQSKAAAAQAQNGAFHLIKDCGHYAPIEQPKAFNAVVQQVIRKYSG